MNFFVQLENGKRVEKQQLHTVWVWNMVVDIAGGKEVEGV